MLQKKPIYELHAKTAEKIKLCQTHPKTPFKQNPITGLSNLTHTIKLIAYTATSRITLNYYSLENSGL